MQEYALVYERMQAFTNQRNASSQDEIWCLQHPPVYTLGMAGSTEHILDPGSIPVVKTDRGGQVTYHGPGQLIVYPLVDLRRRGLGIKHYVSLLEQAILNGLAEMGRAGRRRPGAPGVYVDDKKIAALGVRVRKGCCYHGMAINIDMDLSPFKGIHPCGYPGLQVTQLSEQGIDLSVDEAIEKYLPFLLDQFVYNEVEIIKKENADGLKSVVV